ncbi:MULTISPECIES: hypothetical protein [Bifidobacterium]|uniref:Uncharacterized protein n=2 Tax=Bifidobacterium TaxID=1678 RepID=A0A6L4X1B7_9BIFI|nr:MULTISPECIES: hypothetical protein [Bifidobacterium]KAB8287350.1 hypothetical protein DSM100688_1709 [Bifidobacterium ramosum]MBT1179679.1 hypothetical protein [Bifidobacterium vespertilionis]MBT1181053.1 hypothetical protein [Bifidobacterium sp. CP2]NEG55598.1 hypothetical protein [Bifidobacterium platyrrhinorum]NEG72382.1 hypothetical protein [Bifidobacterium ramosum]
MASFSRLTSSATEVATALRFIALASCADAPVQMDGDKPKLYEGKEVHQLGNLAVKALQKDGSWAVVQNVSVKSFSVRDWPQLVELKPTGRVILTPYVNRSNRLAWSVIVEDLAPVDANPGK